MNTFPTRKPLAVGLFILFAYGLLIHLPYIHLKEFQGMEGIRVVVAQNMLKSGDWVVPSLEGSVYLKKPPLFNWILAGMFDLTGSVSEATSRSVSVLAALLAAMAISLLWQRISQDQGIGFVVPGLIFLTFPDVIDKTIRGAEIDLTFALFVMLAMGSWFYLQEVRKRPAAAWIISLALMGFSFLIKGVQAPAFFYGGVLPYLVYKKQQREIFSRWHVLGIAAALAVSAVWLLPLAHRMGLEKLLNEWWYQIGKRAEPLEGSAATHLLTFPLEYVGAYLPWILLLGLWRNRPLSGEPPIIQRLAVFCLMSLLFSVPLYWVIPGARVRYVLPVSGMVAVLAFLPLRQIIAGKMESPRWLPLSLTVLGILMSLAALSAPLWGRKFGVFDRVAPPILLGGLLLSGVFLVSQRHASTGRRIAIVFLCLLFLRNAGASLYLPYHAGHMSYYREAAAQINRLVPPETPLYNLNTWNLHITYYLNRPVIRILEFVPSELPAGAVVYTTREVAERIPKETLTVLGTIKARRDVLIVYRVERVSRPASGQ